MRYIQECQVLRWSKHCENTKTSNHDISCTSNSQRLRSAGDNDQKSKRFWCALYKFQGVDNPNARDQTAFWAFYSFFLEVQTKLATYEPCNRNSNWRLALWASLVTRSYREKTHVASSIAGKGLR